MQDYRPRPGDEHVEPLFGGLGVRDDGDTAEGRVPDSVGDLHAASGRGRALVWVLALSAAAAGAWALLAP